jgi:hypothetical protein
MGHFGSLMFHDRRRAAPSAAFPGRIAAPFGKCFWAFLFSALASGGSSRAVVSESPAGWLWLAPGWRREARRADGLNGGLSSMAGCNKLDEFLPASRGPSIQTAVERKGGRGSGITCLATTFQKWFECWLPYHRRDHPRRGSGSIISAFANRVAEPRRYRQRGSGRAPRLRRWRPMVLRRIQQSVGVP